MMQKTTKISLILAVWLVFPAISHADAKTFRVRDDGGSKVTFVSDAPLETITGLSTKVQGGLTVDPSNITATKGRFKVPIASIRTGNDLRDEHMQGENWLDAKESPYAHFHITEIKGPKSLKPNKDTKVKVKGKFTVHGITKFVEGNATVRWIPYSDKIKGTPGIDNDVLRVKADFTTQLEDHQVSVPSIVRLKVANQIAVSVDLRAIAE